MNELQFNVLSKFCNLAAKDNDMCKLIIVDGLTAYKAENEIYGRTTFMGARMVKRIDKYFTLYKSLLNT